MQKPLLTLLLTFLTLPALAAGPATKKTAPPPDDDETVYTLRRLLHTQLLDECRSSERTGAEGNVKGRVVEGDLDDTGLPMIYIPAPDKFNAWLAGWREYVQQNQIPANANHIRCAWDTSADSFEYVRGAIYTNAAGQACKRIGDNPPTCMFVERNQLCRREGAAKPTCRPL